MTTYVVRHGQTNYSKRYLVNGDPAKHVHLNQEGRQSLGHAWATLPLHAVATWLTSEFPRARQTTSLLMGVPAARLVVDARLNELDYGEFEGHPSSNTRSGSTPTVRDSPGRLRRIPARMHSQNALRDACRPGPPGSASPCGPRAAGLLAAVVPGPLPDRPHAAVLPGGAVRGPGRHNGRRPARHGRRTSAGSRFSWSPRIGRRR
ncbi:histidine phosphatase family protein [Streptomyces sp. M10(2022)]